MISMSIARTLPGLALVLLLAACSRQDALREILASGELVVVSRYGPTTYYLETDGPGGFEYALAELLAQDLGVTLAMEPAHSLADLFSRLRRREVHLAAAGLTLTPQRATMFPHAQPYDRITTQVVYRAGNRRPREIAQLLDRHIVVLAGSSHAEALRRLRREQLPDLVWREIDNADTMALLDLVKSGEAELALIDANEFAAQQGLYPGLKTAFDLGVEQDIVWYLPPGTDNARLLDRINSLLARLRDEGALERLREIHFGHLDSVSRMGSHTFTRKMQTVLPRYRALIQRVAGEYQLDWRLLAAVAYQESHWNPTATSPTGVRGMMMLTMPTAREMGVDNRLDATQSLRGGARYLKNILRRLPPDIGEPDRTWMALAAYNVGLGHLEDARVLTQAEGANPRSWREVMERLPLLQRAGVYQRTRHGYARGREAVTFVQNIRHYHTILQWQELPGNQTPPPLRVHDYIPAPVGRLELRAL